MTDATRAATPPATPIAGTDSWAMLQQLLCGRPAAADHLASALRVAAHGHTTFGRTDALDLFALHPLALSSAAQVLVSPRAIAEIDDTADGRTIGAFADLVDGVISRLWVVTATAAGAMAEPAVAMARDDFMSQLRQHCHGDAADHPGLDAGDWGHVTDLGITALGALHLPPAASSSQAWVKRAFDDGGSVAARYRLRVHTATLPRQAHDTLVLGITRVRGQNAHAGAGSQQRLAVSEPLPDPAPVSFGGSAAA